MRGVFNRRPRRRVNGRVVRFSRCSVDRASLMRQQNQEAHVPAAADHGGSDLLRDTERPCVRWELNGPDGYGPAFGRDEAPAQGIRFDAPDRPPRQDRGKAFVVLHQAGVRLALVPAQIRLRVFTSYCHAFLVLAHGLTLLSIPVSALPALAPPRRIFSTASRRGSSSGSVAIHVMSSALFMRPPFRPGPQAPAHGASSIRSSRRSPATVLPSTSRRRRGSPLSGESLRAVAARCAGRSAPRP